MMSKKVRISENQYRGLFEEYINVSYSNPLSIEMLNKVKSWIDILSVQFFFVTLHQI